MRRITVAFAVLLTMALVMTFLTCYSYLKELGQMGKTHFGAVYLAERYESPYAFLSPVYDLEGLNMEPCDNHWTVMWVKEVGTTPFSMGNARPVFTYYGQLWCISRLWEGETHYAFPFEGAPNRVVYSLAQLDLEVIGSKEWVIEVQEMGNPMFKTDPANHTLLSYDGRIWEISPYNIDFIGFSDSSPLPIAQIGISGMLWIAVGTAFVKCRKIEGENAVQRIANRRKKRTAVIVLTVLLAAASVTTVATLYLAVESRSVFRDGTLYEAVPYDATEFPESIFSLEYLKLSLYEERPNSIVVAHYYDLGKPPITYGVSHPAFEYNRTFWKITPFTVSLHIPQASWIETQLARLSIALWTAAGGVSIILLKRLRH